MPLPQIHRSDILAFYTKLLKHGFAINSLESINTIVHPTLEMAVDDDYIRKNPSKGIYRKLKTDGSAPKPKRRIALTKTQQQNFLRFIAKSPKVFVAHPHRERPDGFSALIELEGVETWLFWYGDLIQVENIQTEEGE